MNNNELITSYLLYDPTPLSAISNDIALIKLSDPAPDLIDDDAPHISKVLLPVYGDYRFPYNGQVCYTKGFGCTSGNISLGRGEYSNTDTMTINHHNFIISRLHYFKFYFKY